MTISQKSLLAIFCHSVQAKRDTESSNISKFWMPVFTGMTDSRDTSDERIFYDGKK